MLIHLNHPNIIKFLGVQLKKSRILIIMEYMSEGSVAQMMRHYGSFPESILLKFLRQVLHGLLYLHGMNIIHSDIKVLLSV